MDETRKLGLPETAVCTVGRKDRETELEGPARASSLSSPDTDGRRGLGRKGASAKVMASMVEEGWG